MTVSRAVRDLLATRVDTFEKLDLIVALHGARGPLPIDELAAAMGTTRTVVRQTIGELRKDMFVDLTSQGDVQLIIPTEADRNAVAELVEIYGADRAIVVRTLGELALGRIRGLAARAFSDAFVLGKGKKGSQDG